MPTVTVPISFTEIGLAGQTLADLRERLQKVFAKAVRTAAYSSQKRLREITPVSQRPWERTPGTLRDTMFVAERGTTGIYAMWTQPYAEWVDKGTPAHVVLPKNEDKLLHWQPGPGVWGHSKGHMIRGIRPHNLTEQAQQVMREELETALITLILAEIGGITS